MHNITYIPPTYTSRGPASASCGGRPARRSIIYYYPPGIIGGDVFGITIYIHIYRTCAPCAVSGAPRKKIFFFGRFANFFLSLTYCTRVSVSLSLSLSFCWPTHTHTQTHAHTHTHQGPCPRNTRFDTRTA